MEYDHSKRVDIYQDGQVIRHKLTIHKIGSVQGETKQYWECANLPYHDGVLGCMVDRSLLTTNKYSLLTRQNNTIWLTEIK